MGNPHFSKYDKHRWKKGQAGNPKGSSKLMRAIGTLKKTSLTEFVSTIQQLSEMSTEDIKVFEKRNDVPIYQSIIASALVDARKTGNYFKLNNILERAYGRVPQKIEAVAPPSTLDLSKLSDDELDAFQKLLTKAERNDSTVD